MSRPHLILATIFATLVCTPLLGQEEVTIYNETNGLPRSSINDIQRDSKGLFWLATELGIYRFDGRNFIEVAPRDSSFRTQEVLRLRIHGDSLFLIYRDSGCMMLNLTKLQFQLISREPLDDILVLPDGDCIATFRSGFIARRKRETWVRKVWFGGNRPGILAYHQGRLLASLPWKGLFELAPDDLHVIRRYDLMPIGYMDVFSANAGRLYHIMDGVMREFDTMLKSMRPYRPPMLGDTYITQYTACSKELIYLIADNKRLIEARGNRHRIIPIPGVSNVELKKLWVQDGSHLLIGTNQGLIHIRTGPWATTRLTELKEDTTRSIRIRRKILEVGNGRLLFLGSPIPYTYSERDGFAAQSKSRADMYDAVKVNGSIYVTTEGGGLARLDGQTLEKSPIQHKALNPKGGYFSVVYDTLHKKLIIGGYAELIHYDPVREVAEPIPIPSGLGYLQSLYRDPLSGRLWIGAENAIVCLDSSLSNVRFLARIGRGLRGRLVSELLNRSGTRELWVAHERGVDIYDLDSMKQQSSLPDGIFRNPRVVSMLEDWEGRIWMGTYSGIVGFDPKSKEFCRLNRENGLMNIEFNYKSAARLSDGRLIFGGLNGYDLVDPKRILFASSGARGIVTGLHRFSSQDTLFEPVPTFPGTMSFNIRDEFLRIYLSSANTLQASQHTYEYDLDGKGQWIGISGQSYINLLRLEPGLHTVDVRGFDEYGRVLGFERLVIRAREPFLTSSFFQVVLTIAAISFLTLFIIVLLRSRRKEKTIKERISMDLHDEVGTILTRALYVAQSDQERPRDSRVIHYLNESLFSLRAYINTMNTPSFPFMKLVDEVREMSQSLLGQSPCLPEIRHREEQNPLLRGELYRDIRLCLYEIINNTVKHSGADRLRILLYMSQGVLTVYTADNGRLHSTEELTGKGNGIRNLRKRVSKHRGDIHFGIGRRGNGLTIRMRFGIQT